MTEMIKLRSNVTAELLRKKLRRGTLLASIGALLLLATGTFIPVNVLSYAGPPTIIVGLLLITAGLIPYRQLSQLNVKPDTLVITTEGIQFSTKGTPRFCIPFSAIKEAVHLQKNSLYGIRLQLKKSEDRMAVIDPNFAMQKMIDSSKNSYDCDLFFPYFNQYSAETLEDCIVGEREEG